MASSAGRFAGSGWLFSMSRLCQRVTLTATGFQRHKALGLLTQMRMQSQGSTDAHNPQKFDEETLEHLVCPLSKKDLRYDKENNELVCDEIGVAYPIINGIPNLVPQDARMLKSPSTETEPSKS